MEGMNGKEPFEESLLKNHPTPPLTGGLIDRLEKRARWNKTPAVPPSRGPFGTIVFLAVALALLAGFVAFLWSFSSTPQKPGQAPTETPYPRLPAVSPLPTPVSPAFHIAAAPSEDSFNSGMEACRTLVSRSEPEFAFDLDLSGRSSVSEESL